MENGVPTIAIEMLSSSDPIMGKLIKEIGPVNFNSGGQLYESLINSVVSQVISTTAAETVSRRMRSHTQDLITPEVMIQIDQETFRSFGIGAQKYRYIKSITESFLAEPDRFKNIHTLTDKEVLQNLIALRGIGKWSAQMILIFNLGRTDVFAPDDLGLRNAMIRHYDLPDTITPKQLELHAEKWSPYRSIASIYLWNSIKKW